MAQRKSESSRFPEMVFLLSLDTTTAKKKKIIQGGS